MKKSLVISTIATVLVVVVALTTATFAWFSTSSVSQASAEFVIDTSGGTIQITAWDKSTGPGTWAAAPYSGTDDQMPLGQYTGTYEWALTQTNGATGTDAGGTAENALTSYRPLMPVKEIDFTTESATEGSNGLPDVDFVNANQMASGIKVVGSQAKPVVARFRLDTIKANIDVNINVGTIFSILRRPAGSTGEVSLEEVLQPGIQQVAAGYILYGPSTMLVFSTGQGVHGFTLDPGVGEFLLSHPDMRIPEQGHIYSVNEGNRNNWDEPAREAVEWFHTCKSPEGKDYSARYVGSLVADFHRTLLYGGIYLYPPDKNKPNGKLRMMCEAAPLAFLAEQAGGKASDGRRRILERRPETLHARTPLYIGSARDVEAVEAIYAKYPD